MRQIPQLVTMTGLTLLAGCAATDRVEAPAPALSDVAWRSIGLSVESRPIIARTAGSGSSRIMIIGSIHGNEPEGLPVFDDLASRIEAVADADDATIRLIRDMNPDGTAAGSRTNARGVDLNRNWPATNFRPDPQHGPSAASEPETQAVLRDIDRFGPDLILVFHSTRSGPFVNHDGPQPAARHLAGLFAEAAREHDRRWRVVDDMGYPTPGSMGSFLGLDRSIPILTVEFRRSDLSDPPRRGGIDGTLAAVRAHAGRAVEYGR